MTKISAVKPDDQGYEIVMIAPQQASFRKRMFTDDDLPEEIQDAAQRGDKDSVVASLEAAGYTATVEED